MASLRCNGSSLGARHLLHCASISAKASAPKVPQTAAVVPPKHCKGTSNFCAQHASTRTCMYKYHVYVCANVYVLCINVGMCVHALCTMRWQGSRTHHAMLQNQLTFRAVSKSLPPSSVATTCNIGKPIILAGS